MRVLKLYRVGASFGASFIKSPPLKRSGCRFEDDTTDTDEFQFALPIDAREAVATTPDRRIPVRRPAHPCMDASLRGRVGFFLRRTRGTCSTRCACIRRVPFTDREYVAKKQKTEARHGCRKQKNLEHLYGCFNCLNIHSRSSKSRA